MSIQESPLSQTGPVRRASGLAMRSFSYLRALTFLNESLPLQWLDMAINREGSSKTASEIAEKNLLPHYVKLIEEDVKNILDGVYPASVLFPEGVRQHARRYGEILKDAVRLSFRRKNKSYHDFSTSAKIEAQGLPDYYVRNFHNQTNGYLSEASADFYDHQVEILFRGTAGAMRRLILPPLQRLQKNQKANRVLEVGCGTGSATKDVLKTFPKMNLTAIDLSRPYLKHAARSLSRYPQAQFIFANAENLPFADQSFDVIFSVYLFHELPQAARQQVLREMHRALAPGGSVLLVDSLQKGDLAEFDSALDLFPQIFHEPFFKNYVQAPMSSLLAEAGFTVTEEKLGGSSKLWVARKDSAPEIKPNR